MIFNSLEFVVFFPVVTGLYFTLPHRLRWMMLLVASCVFYMAFIPSYILILFVTIVIDYCAAIYIERAEGAARRRALVVSIVSTCLVLFVFKYLGFFNASVQGLARLIGWNYSIEALQIVLPIGLSFHTFQSLSYVVEVYRGHQRAERHFGIYALYVMFYPQLVAGPIERPQNLLHQFREKHLFDLGDVQAGLTLMVWGFFKKVVIADRLALYVNAVYGHPTDFNGPALAVATVAFAYQIYCDFSGYSDIAIGAARVMGFRLMKNFDAPYWSQSIGEFWKRWHISLSTWFRDYLYIPLGGNRVSPLGVYRNLLITFLLSGLWHGANWTYVIWGALNGIYLTFGHLSYTWRTRAREWIGLSPDGPTSVGLRVAGTFVLTCVAWVFFRANTVKDAFQILTRLGTGWSAPLQRVELFSAFDTVVVSVAIVVLELVHWLQVTRRLQSFELQWPVYLRWPAYYVLVGSIILFGIFEGTQFIYFQF